MPYAATVVPTHPEPAVQELAASLGAVPGDIVICRRFEPEVPVAVVHCLDRGHLPEALELLKRLGVAVAGGGALLSGEIPVPAPPSVRAPAVRPRRSSSTRPYLHLE